MQINNPYFYSEDMNAIYDIYELFKYYNQYFFLGILQKSTIEWSKKMTLCAGTCQHKGFGSCSIKLSQPLLKFRTPNQLKETILHEMIHGYLFITNPKACLTEGGHGKQFKEIMNNINNITNLRVTVYHSFTDQVQSYRTHVWRCDGICRQNAPYFGYVKRSMNRKPQAADQWFKDHQRYCGGQFIKISQPQNSKKNMNLKNGKSLKTSMQLEKKQNNFNGNGKTLQQYAKQMSKKQNKKQRNVQNQKQFSNSEQFEFEIPIQSNFEKQILNNRKQKKEQKKQYKSKESEPNKQKPKKQKSKSKGKADKQKQQRNSHKITEWFGKKAKTIQEYSKQIQEQKLMNSMYFKR